jgi:hypothetical protein
MYQQEDLLPSNRNYTLLIGCFTILFSIIVIYFVIASIKPTEEEKAVNIFTPQATQPLADLTLYNQDSDRDLIPNFIEEEKVLNTYLPEISYCEQANPTCDSNPLSNEFFISILIDSSTSMNIPAKDSTKIELVKNQIIQILNRVTPETFVKTQFIGFGNNGNLSFIANNQSCVSNYSFKTFDQVLKGPETNPLVVNNLVPNGKSPIGYTLEQAEKSFPVKQGNNLVIIITDGIDDCNYDLNTTIRGVLARGTVKKINLISLFAPQDEEQKLREAVESNGGYFTNSDSIANTVNNWKNDFILTNWCKYKDTQKQFQCLDNNYSTATTALDEKIKTTTPLNEQNKIKEIKSSIGLLIQNYQKSKTDSLSTEFEKIYTDFLEKDR